MCIRDRVTTASGTFASGKEYAQFFDVSRLGAITTKGLSLNGWAGNDTPRIAETPSGMLNSIGLQNPGVAAFVEKDLPWLREVDTQVIVNVSGHSVAEYQGVVEALETVSYTHLDVYKRQVKSLLFQSACARRSIHLAEYDALDLSAKKLSVLEERVAKAGGSIASALAHDATQPLPVADEAFDLIFIDAPCTGLGTLRRHPEIKARLHKEDAKKLSSTSQAMLAQAAHKVKPGSYLMFATCTILKEENEKTVKRFLASPAGSAFEIVPIGAQGTSCLLYTSIF